MKKTQYICDQCKKKKIEVEDGTGYPYCDGWTYLYSTELKFNEGFISVEKDKHFCCAECMSKFINKGIEEISKGAKNE